MRRVFAMTTHIWLLLIISLAFNVGFGSTLAVQKVRQMGGGRCAHPGAEPVLCRSCVFAPLELSSEQAEQFAAAQDALIADMAVLRGELEAERSRLGELLTTSVPDENAIAAQLDRVSALQRRVQHCVVTHLLVQRQQLTPEQRTRYDDVIRQRICPCDEAGAAKPCLVQGNRRDACNGPIEP